MSIRRSNKIPERSSNVDGRGEVSGISVGRDMIITRKAECVEHEILVVNGKARQILNIFRRCRTKLFYNDKVSTNEYLCVVSFMYELSV